MTSPNHALFVAPGIGLGGAETHLIRYANGLVQRGYKVTIVVTGSERKFHDLLTPTVQTLFLNGRGRNPLLWLRLALVVRNIAPDFVIGWSRYSNYLAVATTVFFRPRKLIVIELNYPPAARMTVGPAKYLLLKFLSRYLLSCAHVIAANSDEAISVLRKWAPGAETYRRVFNPLDFEYIDSLATQALPPEAASVAPNDVLLLALGRIYLKQKGFDALLKACALLKDLPNWKLLVVGDGPDSDTFASQVAQSDVAPRVIRLAAVKNPFPLYKRADIVILPSRFEGFPNVLFEALALGKATVSTDCQCGPREMTRAGTLGRLVAVDDIQNMAEHLRGLINNPDQRKLLGAAAKSYIRAEYSEERVFESLTSCFD